MGRVCQTWVWRSIRGWVTAFHDQQAPNMLGMSSSTGVFLVNLFILGLLFNIWNYIRQIDMGLRYQNTHLKMRPPSPNACRVSKKFYKKSIKMQKLPNLVMAFSQKLDNWIWCECVVATNAVMQYLCRCHKRLTWQLTSDASSSLRQ